MKNTVRFILIGLTVGIVLATISHAQGVKLVAWEDVHPLGDRLSTDVHRNTVILGVGLKGFAKIYTGKGRNWKEQAEIVAKDRVVEGEAVGGGFGWVVSISGGIGRSAGANVAIVGAPGTNDAGDNSGSAYIFVPGEHTWKQQAKLVSADAARGDAFGSAVSIDRSTAIVGASKDDDAGTNSGSAYIFVREGVVWKQQAKLVPSDLRGSDDFGGAVYIQGSTVVVGAKSHTHGGVKTAGAAYIFARNGERWVEQAKLTAPDAASRDGFGFSVAISGNTVVVGAPSHDTDGKADAGAAYIYELDGNTWKQQVKLISDDTGKRHKFGYGVEANGNTIIIGAPGDDDVAPGAGAAFSYVRVDEVWQAKKKVVTDDAGKGYAFGSWVATSHENVVVSSVNESLHGPQERPHGTAAYVYNGIDDFGTPPFAIDPFGLRVTSLGKVKRTALYQNFPNPFNPETWLPYRLAADATVSLRIYNVKGQLIRELPLGPKKAGYYLTRETAAYWDGSNEIGESVSTGVYFYQLEAGMLSDVRRMVLAK